jgi:hypothetical protein
MTSFALLLGSSLAAAAAADGDLKFLIMGDWGGTQTAPFTTDREVATAAGMGKVGAAVGSQFALALGDNFYFNGISTDEHDPRFQTTFENVFTADSLKADDYFRVVAGNHDHNGNVTAQIAYSAHSNRWSFPSLYYTFTETAPDGATVQVVYIDTVVLSGGSSDPATGEDLPGSRYPGPADAEAAQTQMQWLEATLAASTADYLVVGGHFPVWSVCEHGPTGQLVSDVKPLLEKYGVTAYVSGHDHCAQHLDEGTGVDYHVIGSANFWDSSTVHLPNVPAGSLKWHPASGMGGFALVTANKTAFVVTHMSGDGGGLYVAPARAPRCVGCPTPPPTPRPTPPPTPPTPVPQWDCRAGMAFQNNQALVDVDLAAAQYDISGCEQACVATAGCAAIMLHGTDKHCHTFSGALTAAEFGADLAANAEYEACFRQ